jgi:UDP-N-acetylmuramyl pentapeptide phosphotransferase/UDP-N-acetylglucosamine-1-phosphate transferase
MDLPNERSSHLQPVPRGGGMAVIISVSLCLLLYLGYGQIWSVDWLAVVACAFFLGMVSLIDDLRSVSFELRLTSHVLAAMVTVYFCSYWRSIALPSIGEVNLGLWGFLLTVIWIVGLTNAFNFMDGIDGIAAGQAIVAGLAWFSMGLLTGDAVPAAYGAFVASACLAFLCFNRPPARIFLGDVGSAFLGFSFAVLPVMAARQDARMAVAGMVFVAPFLFDTTFTLIRRLRMRENIFSAHRSHLYQRLVITGFSHLKVSFLYSVAAGICSIAGLMWISSVKYSGEFLPAVVLLCCLSQWLLVSWAESREHARRLNLPGSHANEY